MSAFVRITDSQQTSRDVRNVPTADIAYRKKTKSARLRVSLSYILRDCDQFRIPFRIAAKLARDKTVRPYRTACENSDHPRRYERLADQSAPQWSSAFWFQSQRTAPRARRKSPERSKPRERPQRQARPRLREIAS